jgi:hypothetical protein
LAAGLLLAMNPLRGATLVVTNLSDTGPGTLRGIISGPLVAGDTVQFDPSLSGQTIVLTSGEIQLDQNVTIDASALPGGITINGNHNSRIFEVFANVSAALTSLTLTNGYATSGGAVLNSGTLLATLCTFAGNTVYNGGGGGGIANNLGSVGLIECTLSGNSASSGGGVGGGIFNLSGGQPVVLDQCTVSGNSAGTGGGFDSVNLGAANLSTLSVFNTIIAGNTAAAYADVAPDSGAASPTQQGVNLIGGNPLLAPLGNYGGPTPTMPPLPGSPAIDGCTNGALFSTDQRGYPRIVGPFEDIGAVELQTAELQTPVLVVTTNSDSGPGSLRQVISQVDITATISFAPNLSGATITLTNGEILLTKDMAIDASVLPGGLTISGNHASRIFEVSGGFSDTLTELTLINGNVGTGQDGGGIYNLGNLTVNQCTVYANYAPSLLGGGLGGGIYNLGNLTVNQCTVTGNAAYNGGGLGSSSPGTVNLNQSTLSGNSTSSGQAGGGIYNSGASFIISNSIVDGGTSGGGLTLSGVNLINGTSLLAPLGNYGGPTPTMPPLPGSPAIDACTNGTAFATDQRGFPRIVGLFPDIGAVEGVYNPAGPGTLTGVTRLGNGSFMFSFTNYTDTSYTVLASTNLAAPLNTWFNLGPAVESPVGSGQFSFTDPQATNNPAQFYRVRSP